MKKNRIIAMMCAAIMATTPIAMVGCADNTKTGIDKEFYISYNDAYISLNTNGKFVLHRGDAEKVLARENNMSSYIANDDYEYTLDCGKHFVSDIEHQFANTEEEIYYYAEKCEGCFDIE